VDRGLASAPYARSDGDADGASLEEVGEAPRGPSSRYVDVAQLVAGLHPAAAALQPISYPVKNVSRHGEGTPAAGEIRGLLGRWKDATLGAIQTGATEIRLMSRSVGPTTTFVTATASRLPRCTICLGSWTSQIVPRSRCPLCQTVARYRAEVVIDTMGSGLRYDSAHA
jgi:hypothetical protein